MSSKPDHIDSHETIVCCEDFRDSLSRDPYMGKKLFDKTDLVFVDPPFNIGHPYVGFNDSQEDVDYRNLICDICSWAMDLLKPGGRFCMHVPDEVVYLVLREVHLLNEQGYSRFTASDWIIWHYRFGQCGKTKYINSKCHLLTFIKDGREPTWNPDAVSVPSDRASKYKDKRTDETQTPGMRVPLDVWGIPSDGQYWGRVQGNSSERRSRANGALVDHPNQLPEVYMKRIIKGWTNPGDWVVDFCGGSGTTGVVSAALGRNSMTFEISEENAKSIEQRLDKGAVRV